MTGCAPARGRGFTLLEVVVAIALFSLLMSIVYAGFNTAVRAYDAAEQRVDEVERMRVVSAFIRRSVGAAPALAIAVRGQWTLQFEGTPQRLRYIADLPGYVGGGGLHEVVLELEQNGDQRDLVMRRRPFVLDRFDEIDGEYETRVLSEQIKEFALRFYGRSDDGGESNDGGEPTWRDDWPSAKTMPLLVQVSITPTSGLPWPVLQVRAHVDAVRYVKGTNAALVGASDEERAAAEARRNPSADQVLPDGRLVEP